MILAAVQRTLTIVLVTLCVSAVLMYVLFRTPYAQEWLQWWRRRQVQELVLNADVRSTSPAARRRLSYFVAILIVGNIGLVTSWLRLAHLSTTLRATLAIISLVAAVALSMIWAIRFHPGVRR
jgi:hypothetical protein